MKHPWYRRLLQRAARNFSVFAGMVANGPFNGAQYNRLTMDWARRPIAPDKELYGKLGTLRARVRDLVRNDAHAAQAMRLFADNVVGAAGIVLQCKVITRKGRLEVETNRMIEAKWAEWGRKENCTVNGRHSWVDVQRAAVQLVEGEGEFLLRMRPGIGPFSFGLQMLDADLLDEQFNVPAGDGQNEIRMGVELDAFERPVAYHFLRSHPDALNARQDRAPRDQRVPVPAEEIIHLYATPRIGQTRGVSSFAPVMYNLRMLQGYQEAEVVAARIAASKMGAIKTDAEAYGNVEGEAPNGLASTMDVEPGSFMNLLPGQSIEMFNPEHPTQQYRDFVKGMVQSVASGLGLSYASLSGDLEGTSYASGRTGLLQERDHYRAKQMWLVEHLCRRVFNEWLKYAVLSGQVPIDDAKRRQVEASIMWQPRGWGWVDPKNDVEASVLAIQHGLENRSTVLASQGRDFEDVVNGLKQEDDLAGELAVDIIGPATAAASLKPAPADAAPQRKRKD